MEKKEKKKMGLTSKIFIALLLGGTLGVIIYNYVPSGQFRDTILVGGIFRVIGDGFLRAMQMLVVPLVFSSLVCGSMSIGDTKRLGKVGLKTVGFYLVTTALAITVAITVALIIQPGLGLNIPVTQAVEEAAKSPSFAQTLLEIVPKNPVAALAEGNMLQIILFSIILGIILAKLGDRVETVFIFFTQFNDIMMEMTTMVMKIAPIGVFCLVAKTFSEIGLGAFGHMLSYMFSVFLALAIQCFGVYLVMLKLFTGLSPFRFIRKFSPVMGFAFSTATSNATVPLSIETLSKRIGVSRKISAFTIPLGATLNMDGTAIMQGVAVVFVANAFGISLSLVDFLTVIATATVASIGTAGVPSVGLITLSMVFASVGLPVEGIALIMGIDRVLDMARTAVNITGDAVCTTIVAKQDGMLDRRIFDRE